MSPPAPTPRSAAADTLVAFLSFLLLACLHAPGRITPDTKYDLLVDPVGFLSRSLHVWTDLSFSGQVQNQSYGYLFPQGPYFALGHLSGIPMWVVERLWWAVVLTAAFTGTVRLAAALGVRGRVPRLLGGLAYALAPRMLSELTAISAEIWPVALAPWVMLPVVRALQGRMTPRRAGAGAALALALMGAVNAVATVAACLPAVLWWLLHRPGRTWARLAAWWLPLSLAVSVWWLVPLVVLGRVSPPFLDYIESSAVTTRWTSLAEVVRGTSAWVPFVSGERVAGQALTSSPALVLGTGVLAAAGIAGLCSRRLPGGRKLLLIAGIGVAALAAAWVGPAGGGLAAGLRALLDGPLAPLRNVHKAEPLVRLPLAIGLAHLFSRVPVPSGASTVRERARTFLHPERDRLVAAAMVAALALAVSAAPAWTGRLATMGSHTGVPDHWREAAAWLSENAPLPPPGARPGTDQRDPAATTRALVVPGASFGEQVWGVSRDEPLQPLSATPWAVRDSIPLQPAPAIRALDAVQRLFADGRPAPGLAATLAGMGMGYLVVRNDLAATSGAPRPVLVHRALSGSPGLVRVAAFGDAVGGDGEVADDGTVHVADGGLRPAYPAVEIYRVDSRLGSDARLPGPPQGATAPYVVDARALPVVAGGPEAGARLDDLAAARGRVDSPPRTTRLTLADARAAGLTVGPGQLVLTDTPADRETDLGRVDHHTSAIRADGDPRRSMGTRPDYAASVDEDVPLTRGEWTGARVTASSSASDSSRAGEVRPGASTAAAFDDDPTTAWRSGDLDSAFGQWLRLDLDTPADRMLLTLTVPEPLVGAAVSRIRVSTEVGSTVVTPEVGRPLSVPLPPGTTGHVMLEATGVADGGRGHEFGLDGVALFSGQREIPIRHDVVLPPAPDPSPPSGWLLTQEFPGRAECVDGGSSRQGPDGTTERSTPVRCSSGLAVPAEEPGRLARVLDVPRPVGVVPDLLVRPRFGVALGEVLRGDPASRARQVRATGASPFTDPRGAAGAAVDGDRSTSWHADPADPAPALRLDLPERALVDALRIVPPAGAVPAAPTVVTVDTGGQRTRVDLSALSREPDGAVVVPVPADLTDRVTVRLDRSAPVVGGAGTVAPGIAEVSVLDPAGARIGAVPAADDDPVTLGCSDGPRLTVDGRSVRFRLSASRQQLLSGTAVRATACSTDPVRLPAGEARVEVSPGAAFTVDSVALSVPPAPDAGPAHALGAVPQPTRAVETTRWEADRRELHLPASARERVLVIPESVNSGWRVSAVRADGSILDGVRAVAVDGWQQGVVLPPTTDDVTAVLSFPLDAPYRAALATGPPALLLVLVLFLLRGRDRSGAAARPWRTGVGVAAAVVITGAGVVCGLAGLAVSVLGALACAVAVRRWGPGRLHAGLVAGAVAGIAAGAGWLSIAPWPSPGGYAGDGPGPQLLTMAGLVCAGLAAVPWGAPVRGGARSQRRGSSARRAGSSTNE